MISTVDSLPCPGSPPIAGMPAGGRNMGGERDHEGKTLGLRSWRQGSREEVHVRMMEGARNGNMKGESKRKEEFGTVCPCGSAHGRAGLRRRSSAWRTRAGRRPQATRERPAARGFVAQRRSCSRQYPSVRLIAIFAPVLVCITFHAPTALPLILDFKGRPSLRAAIRVHPLPCPRITFPRPSGVPLCS